MNIAQSLKDLGPVDISALSEVILGFDEDTWREEQLRQKKYSEVHYNTESVILIFCDHDNWPEIDVVKGTGWDRLAEIGLPLMHEIIGTHYVPGGTIIRAMAAKLKSRYNHYTPY